MHLVDIVLFFHIAAVLVVFALIGVLHTGQYVMRSAKTVQEVRTWANVSHRLEPIFPFMGIALFAFGAWLLHLSDGEFTWSDGWVDTAIVSLVVLMGVGGALLGPRTRAIHDVVAAAPDGPIGPDVRSALMNKTLWTMSHFNSLLVTSVVFVMVTKPSGWASALIVVIAAGIGAAIGSYAAGPASSPRPTTQEATAAP